MSQSDEFAKALNILNHGFEVLPACDVSAADSDEVFRVLHDVAALRDNTPIADPKLEALRVFAEKINISRGWPEESDIQALFAVG